MPHNENISAPVTLSTVSIPGTASATLSGVAAGAEQSSQASSKSVAELSRAKRDSLLKALDVLLNQAKNPPEDLVENLDLFPEDLQGMLDVTRNGVGSMVGKLSISPLLTASHIAQLPLDVKASIEGLLHSIHDYNQFFQTKAASTLNREVKEHQAHFSANCHALCHNLVQISDQLHAEIDKKFDQKGKAAHSHASVAESTASTAMTTALNTAGFVSLMVDMVGASFREVSATHLLSQEELSNPEKNNVYQAFSACCKSFESKNSNDSLIALQNLEEAILNFDVAADMSEQHKVTGPSMSVLTRLITAEPFIKSLQAVNSAALALSKASEALTKEKDNFSNRTQDSASRASLLKNYSEGDAVRHSQNVSDFCDQFDEAIKHIDKELKPPVNQSGVASSAKGAIRSTSALVIAASLIPGLTGILSREFSGSLDFTQNDKGSKKESTVVSKSRKEMTGADLDQLLTRICNLQERLQRCQELGVSAPVVLGSGEAITSGSLIASLNMIAGMCSALRELRTLSASPSIPLQLNDEEKRLAAESGKEYVQSNKDSAETMGTGVVSDNLSLAKHIDSVMQKVVLTHRSHLNFLNQGERKDINSTGKSTVAFSQGNSTGFLFGSMGILALLSLESGMSTEALLKALRFSTDMKRLSDGVDRLESENGSKTNISFASNATRLVEDKSNNSFSSHTSSKGTNVSSEIVFSRTLLVALCHSGALKEMMRRLIKIEEDKLVHVAGFSDSAIVSDRVMPHLFDNILKVLDDAEADHNPIPGLNRDMASTLGTVSNSTIATALCAHATFISPFLKSIVAARRARNIPEQYRNEAVSAQSELSRIISVSLNIIHAFTGNFVPELSEFRNPIQNSYAVEELDTTLVTNMALSCGASLLCEELFEICISRSLTLMDAEKIAQSSKASKDLANKESALSSAAVKEDSGLGGHYSATQVISALRLTLSHLGVSLRNFAADLNTEPAVLVDNIQMHTMQRSMIKSITSSLLSCSASMMALSGVLSHLPLSTVGSADGLRHFIHSIDKELVLRPVHSSEETTRNTGSEATLITGIGTDCMASILCMATKLLLQASVLGMDTNLSIAKLLEILCLHPEPGQALSLELQAMSQPNGVCKNLSEQARSALVAGTVATVSMTAPSKTGDSGATECAIHSLQAGIDYQIDQVTLLADEDEADSFGLQAFYELLIRLLDPRREVDSAAHKDLVKRFNRGGISLSSYHSEHGGVLKAHRGKSTNRLISGNGFLGCDDADALLNTFIKKAIKQGTFSSLLDAAKQELMKHPNRSKKTQENWAFIVNKVIDGLKLANTRHTLFKPGDTRRNKTDLDARKNQLLNQWEAKPVDEAVLVSSSSKH